MHGLWIAGVQSSRVKDRCPRLTDQSDRGLELAGISRVDRWRLGRPRFHQLMRAQLVSCGRGVLDEDLPGLEFQFGRHEHQLDAPACGMFGEQGLDVIEQSEVRAGRRG
jgi:hypothetical protein